jgi:uncharacterized protein YfbU (UPF0304 family)
MGREWENNDMPERDFIPEPSSVIWKYMNFPEFMNLLQFRKLHFTRADNFKDELEGEVPYFYIESLKMPQEDEYLRVIDIYKSCKTRTYINSWSELKKESYAMWHIYSKKYGIAVETDCRRLKDIIKPYNGVVRRVKYIDTDKCEDMIRSGLNVFDKKDFHMEDIFTLKPDFYEYEKEIRAIYTDTSKEKYKEIKIDIKSLISSIIISPFASRWFGEMVRDIVFSKYDLKNVKVCISGVEIKE